MFYSPFDNFMFSAFPVFFSILFVLFFVFFIAVLMKGIRQWHSNNQSPRLTVEATVTGKRESISHHTHHHAGDISGMHGSYTTADTSYYATFQVRSGDRMEFQISGAEYGQLMEGDTGELSFQGTRYLGFERI